MFSDRSAYCSNIWCEACDHVLAFEAGSHKGAQAGISFLTPALVSWIFGSQAHDLTSSILRSLNVARHYKEVYYCCYVDIYLLEIKTESIR